MPYGNETIIFHLLSNKNTLNIMEIENRFFFWKNDNFLTIIKRRERNVIKTKNINYHGVIDL